MTQPAHDFLTSLGYVKPDPMADRLRDFMADRDVVYPREIMEFCGFTAQSQMSLVRPLIIKMGYKRKKIIEKGVGSYVYQKEKDFSVLIPKIMKNKNSVSVLEIMKKSGIRSFNFFKVAPILEKLGYEKIRVDNSTVYRKEKDFSVLIRKTMKNKDMVPISQIMKECGFIANQEMSKVAPILEKLGYEKTNPTDQQGKRIHAYEKQKDFDSIIIDLTQGRETISTAEIMKKCKFKVFKSMSKVAPILEKLGYEKIKTRTSTLYQKKKDLSVLIPKLMKKKNSIAAAKLMDVCGIRGSSQMVEVIQILKNLGYKKIIVKEKGRNLTYYTKTGKI